VPTRDKPRRPLTDAERARVEECVPWVQRMAAKWAKRHGLRTQNHEDLASAGFVGLSCAVQDWRPESGCKTFRNYAFARVIGSFKDELRRQLGQNSDRAVARRGYPVILSTLDAWPVEVLSRMRHVPTVPFSSSALTVQHAGFADVDCAEMSTELLQTMHGRERVILEGRLQGDTLKVLAKRLGVSEPRVSQILHGMGERLRKRLWDSGLPVEDARV
jgi:RNA polymerase sigma factor (sigma-70 family)